ncbi:MAG TPA: hypothetical protein VII33_00395, partial [Nakamurella sp.]
MNRAPAPGAAGPTPAEPPAPAAAAAATESAATAAAATESAATEAAETAGVPSDQPVEAPAAGRRKSLTVRIGRAAHRARIAAHRA